MKTTFNQIGAMVLVLAMLLGADCDRDKKQSASSASGGGGESESAFAGMSLAAARTTFQTHIIQKISAGDEIPAPPPNAFSVVQYPSAVGNLSAYLSVDPRDGKRHPAIVWITGGDCNTIGDVWSPQTPDNDQSASQYRQAGIVMMYPSLRGGNQSPGSQERFYGEVDDVLAAADFLATKSYADPNRIYLGGHSTGGTLTLLTAECSDRFRAVFSFGPVGDIRGYGDLLGPNPFNARDPKEFMLRSPQFWLASVKGPTFVFEGDRRTSNVGELNSMAARPNPSGIHFMVVRGATHFSTLAPMNGLIARKILHDEGPTSNISFSDDEVGKLFQR